MRRVVRLEPGHEWHETYMNLPDGQMYLLVPVLERPSIDQWVKEWQPRHHQFVMGDTVKTKRNPDYRSPEVTTFKTVQWSVQRLTTYWANHYGTEWALVGPRMFERSILGVRRSIPGVW